MKQHSPSTAAYQCLQNEEDGSSQLPAKNAELDLLQHLLIGFQSSSSAAAQQTFKLTLFEDEDDTGKIPPAAKPRTETKPIAPKR